jgi:hypothetical protein
MVGDMRKKGAVRGETLGGGKELMPDAHANEIILCYRFGEIREKIHCADR